MNKIVSTLAAALLLFPLSVSAHAAAKKASPQPEIRFEGAPQYTQAELFTATGLQAGAKQNAAQLRARAKQLSDTGYFSSVKFNATRRAMVFTLNPVSDLYPIHLDNLPLVPGKALDDELRQRLPLYHGQLPGSGSALDQACAAFEEILKAKGLQATVKAALTSDLGPKKITAINFTIASPTVRIGAIQYAGVSDAMRAKVVGLAVGQHGNSFDTENTAPGLERGFRELYQDQGYLAAQVSVSQTDPPTVSTDAIEIPFRITVQEGAVYKFGVIRYPTDAPIPRTVVEKFLARYPAGSGRPLDLFLAATRDAYHAKGYLDCTANALPVFNETTHVANYDLEIAAGPVYQLATVRFEGAPDAMLPRLQRAWMLAPGSAFDESYASGFAAQAQKKDRALSKWLQTVLATFEVKTDAETHQATCIFHFAKTTQGGK